MLYKAKAALGVLLIGFLCLPIASVVHAASAIKSDQVIVRFPEFPVRVNGTAVDVKHSEYPLIVYQDVTYLPMTWNNAAALGLSAYWDSNKGFSLQKKDACSPLEQVLKPQSNTNGALQTAELTPFSVRVNGKEIDNSKEPYPVLHYRNITYFPMTWRFTHDEFGWKTSWSEARGFVIESCSGRAPDQDQQDNFYNLSIGGLVAVQGDWIYMNPDSHNTLLKVNKTTGEQFTLTVASASWINVAGDWLYFTASDSAASSKVIYKIKNDGTGRTRISETPAGLIRVKDDSIYYIHTGGSYDMPQPDGIHKMSIDGTGDLELVRGRVNYKGMVISGDKLYYILQEESGTNLYVMNLDGSGQTKLRDDVLRMTVIDGWIYFVQSNGNQLNKMSIDGKIVIPLYTADKMITNLSYRDGWIYLTKGGYGISGEAAIERLRVDGTAREELAAARAMGLYFAGNKLYFPNEANMEPGGYQMEPIDVD